MSSSCHGPPMPSSSSSFHRRPLPCPPAIPFSSAEGKKLFAEAMSNGYMEGYFPLAEQFSTQDEPAFCGLATLTMVLNALAVDPKRQWKGVWRWYHEAMLDCCRSLDEVKVVGITIREFGCLARCNGLTAALRQPQTAGAGDRSGGIDKSCPTMNSHFRPTVATLDEFRSDVKIASSTTDAPFLVVSYSRQTFLQTGDGHFSPVAGYHTASDKCLILDTARFKYPPHWVSVADLYESMKSLDSATQKPRGWFVIVRDPAKETCASSLFPLACLKIDALTAGDLLTFTDVCCADPPPSGSSCCHKKVEGQERQAEWGECVGLPESRILERDREEELPIEARLDVTIPRLLGYLPCAVKDWVETQSADLVGFLGDAPELGDCDGMKALQGRVVAGIRSVGMLPFVAKSLPKPTAFCLVSTFLTLVFLTDDFLVSRIRDPALREAIRGLVQFDAARYPELAHEVSAGRTQLHALREYLQTMYPDVRNDQVDSEQDKYTTV